MHSYTHITNKHLTHFYTHTHAALIKRTFSSPLSSGTLHINLEHRQHIVHEHVQHPQNYELMKDMVHDVLSPYVR
jgi:hypothetical protein